MTTARTGHRIVGKGDAVGIGSDGLLGSLSFRFVCFPANLAVNLALNPILYVRLRAFKLLRLPMTIVAAIDYPIYCERVRRRTRVNLKVAYGTIGCDRIDAMLAISPPPLDAKEIGLGERFDVIIGFTHYRDGNDGHRDDHDDSKQRQYHDYPGGNCQR